MTVTPRGEYPRPHFDRSHSWRSLNGSWDFAADPELTGLRRGLPAGAAAWPSQIVVPFAWETLASGVALHWMPCGWYRRTIEIPAEWAGQQVILHFGSVHHEATVWVDGTEVGSHEGGYTPFELNITAALSGATAVVVVRVEAPIDKREIVHGKQRSIPRDDYDGCSFTPSSGIWQPVWLEARPATHVRRIALRSGRNLNAIEATIEIGGEHAVGATLQVRVSDD